MTISHILPVGLFMMLSIPGAPGQQTIPGPTHAAQSTGLWSNPATWAGGIVPTSAAHNVLIPAGVSVQLDGGGTVRVGHIHVIGSLGSVDTGPGGAETLLGCHSLIVDGNDAAFIIGTESIPYTGKFKLELWGTQVTQDLEGFGTKVLGARNSGLISMHGLAVDPYTELASTVNAGGTSISVFSHGSDGWKIGDRIWIAPTFGPVRGGRKGWDQAEERTITGIQLTDNGGRQLLTFSSPLQHKHLSSEFTSTRTLAPAKEWHYSTRANVAMLDRNIEIVGINPGSIGFGGHVMIMGNMNGTTGMSAGIGRIANVEFRDMGQKSMLGRYPFHWHMLAYEGEGQYFRNNVIYKSFNRAAVIHGTHRTEVTDNVAVDHLGHGMMLEDGAELENVITGNLVALTTRPATGEEVLLSDNQFGDGENNNASPSAFWISHPGNVFDDNIVAGTHGSAYWFVFNFKPTGASASDSRLKNINGRMSGLISFRNNKAYATKMAFDVNDMVDANTFATQSNHRWRPPSPQHLKGTIAWACDIALYTGLGTPEGEVFFDDTQLIGNYISTRFASYHHVRNSLFVADTPDDLYPAITRGVQLYDGAARFENNHWVDFRNGIGLLTVNGGGAGPRANWMFSGNSYNHSGFADLSTGSGGSTGGYGMKSLIDIDGTLGGHPQSTVLSTYEVLMLDGGLPKPANWTDASITANSLGMLWLDAASQDRPMFTRVDTNTNQRVSFETRNAGLFNSLRIFQPIVNETHIVYEVTAITSERLRMRWRDCKQGDSVVLIFPNFGSSTRPSSGVTVVNSLPELYGAIETSFYLSGNTAYFKYVRADNSYSSTEAHDLLRSAADIGGGLTGDLDVAIPANLFSEESDPENDNRIRIENLDHVAFIPNGTWIRFEGIDLESGVESIQVSAASNTVGGNIEVRLSSPDGRLMGTLPISNTGGWQTYRDFSVPLVSATGANDLYLLFTGGNQNLFNVKSFTLKSLDREPFSIATQAASYNAESDPTDQNRIRNEGNHVAFIVNNTWIRFDSFDFRQGVGSIDVSAASPNSKSPGLIEVRVGSQTGNLLGTIDVKTTGGWQNYHTFSAPLESVSGVHDLFLVFVGGDFNLRDFKIHGGLWDITVAAAPESGGWALGSGTYVAGSIAPIAAAPAFGYRFAGWTGAAGINNPLATSATVQPDAHKDLQANFIKLWNLELSSEDPARGTVSGGGTFDEGVPVPISATAMPGFRMGKWNGAGVFGDPTSPETSILLAADTHVSASFMIDSTEGYNRFAGERFAGETDIARIGPMGDFSGNGIPNLIEYALVVDPASEHDRQPVRNLMMIEHEGRISLGVEFCFVNDDPGLTFRAEISQDMVDWEHAVLSFDGTEWISDRPEVIAVHSSLSDGGNTSRVILRDHLSEVESGARFIRVRVSHP